MTDNEKKTSKDISGNIIEKDSDEIEQNTTQNLKEEQSKNCFINIKYLFTKEGFFMDGFYVLSILFSLLGHTIYSGLSKEIAWQAIFIIFSLFSVSFLLSVCVWKFIYNVIKEIFSKKRLVWIIMGFLSILAYILLFYIITNIVKIDVFLGEYFTSHLFKLLFGLIFIVLIGFDGAAITSYLVLFLSVHNLLGFNKKLKEAIKLVFYVFPMGTFIIHSIIAVPLCSLFAQKEKIYQIVDLPYKEELTNVSYKKLSYYLFNVEFREKYDKELNLKQITKEIYIIGNSCSRSNICFVSNVLLKDQDVLSIRKGFDFHNNYLDLILLSKRFCSFHCGSQLFSNNENIFTIKGRHYSESEYHAGYSFKDETPIPTRNNINDLSKE